MGCNPKNENQRWQVELYPYTEEFNFENEKQFWKRTKMFRHIKIKMKIFRYVCVSIKLKANLDSECWSLVKIEDTPRPMFKKKP